jgi:penicillin amidase
MNRIIKRSLQAIAATLLVATAAAAWYLHGKQPQRSGTQGLTGLQAPVEVRYDERGVPHITAANEADLYRALGYVQAQDRLFQMEMSRRLARGELAEVLGPKLLDVDRLFRTLSLRAHANAFVQTLDTRSPAYQVLLAYLDGVNQFQAGHPPPIEFDVLGIPKRPFTPQDMVSISGYLAYSFATALRNEPVMTTIRDNLGPAYLRIFDLEFHPEGVENPSGPVAALSADDWQALNRVAQASRQVLDNTWAPPFEGSNAWAVSGARTASGKPLLAGDPHIGISAPAVWYEAHLSAPGFTLYGHFQPLNPLALLGHNQRFGWSLTMFQNDDMDLVAEKPNPANPDQIWHQGRWVDLQVREETIRVKGAAPVTLRLRQSPNGPIITDAYRDNYGTTPVALWWTFLQSSNPILDAFYALNRADTRDKARAAASQIHAPGLNIVWANAEGDIAWWAAARLPQRPAGVNPTFILDGSGAESAKPGFHPFTDNPQEENPPRGYVVSANQQPRPTNGVAVPGYYHLPDRVQQINGRLRDATVKWDTRNSQSLQLDSQTAYGPRTLRVVLPVLREVVTDPGERALLDQLAAWDGRHDLDTVAATVFNQLLYSLAVTAMQDELGAIQFKNLLGTRALDIALPRLAADAGAPWWDDRQTPAVESRTETLAKVWRHALTHLQSTFGPDRSTWTWGRAHTLTHNHPLGQQKPLDRLFSTGPMPAPGGREIPNALGSSIGPAPWAVTYGPSTRRLIDFADPGQALGINPLGQSGVLFDRHFRDQAQDYIAGRYVRQWLTPEDVAANTRSILRLEPAR